jgi:hypothetical protein
MISLTVVMTFAMYDGNSGNYFDRLAFHEIMEHGGNQVYHPQIIFFKLVTISLLNNCVLWVLIQRVFWVVVTELLSRQQ